MSSGIVLFGASKLGEMAYSLLKDNYRILFYCDNDSGKWGSYIGGIRVISPDELLELRDMEIVITSLYSGEISSQLMEMGIYSFKIFNFKIDSIDYYGKAKLNDSVGDLKVPFIELGAFLQELNEIRIEDAVLMAGSSSILDYCFLKALMIRFGFKTYLEIGTWMGESIAAVSEVAQKCYSISMADDDKTIVDYFKNVNHKNNFSRYFSYKKDNIQHHFGDSKLFDFNGIQEKIDLVFIDGDHSYEGICADTRSVFSIIDKDCSIVVWHDFKDIRNNFTAATASAIFNTLPPELHHNIFAVDTNFCGVYIPDKYMEHFKLEDNPYIIYSYEVSIKAKLNKLNNREKLER